MTTTLIICATIVTFGAFMTTLAATMIYAGKGNIPANRRIAAVHAASSL